jgi:hypothetical protein
MIHVALVHGVLFWLVAVMTLLLVLFLYGVIATPLEAASTSE